MKIFKIAILLMLFPLMTASTAHKFYVSITSIEYAPQEESLQIITKIFLDDLEAALKARYGKTYRFNSTKETDAEEQVLKEYLFKKLKFKVNGKPVSFEYIGKAYDIDIVKAYLEIKGVKQLRSIEIENEVLLNMFEDQQNIIHLKNKDNRRSLILKNGNPKGTLNFDD